MLSSSLETEMSRRCAVVSAVTAHGVLTLGRLVKCRSESNVLPSSVAECPTTAFALVRVDGFARDPLLRPGALRLVVEPTGASQPMLYQPLAEEQAI